jgi:hypothetical protein
MATQRGVTMSVETDPEGLSRGRAEARIGGETERSHRPALKRLRLDVKEIREELLTGFPDAEALLWWHQRVAVRTLGELPLKLTHELARQLRSADGGEMPTLLGALLGGRHANLSTAEARETRLMLYGEVVYPAFHRAYRELRPDAGEYIDSDEGYSYKDAGHEPENQPYVAMRPAVDELESHQQHALADLLNGFETRADILSWGERLVEATHGELDEEFLPRCRREPSTRKLLLDQSPTAAATRIVFAAAYVLPAFTAGVRDLAGRSGEQPADNSEREDPLDV